MECERERGSARAVVRMEKRERSPRALGRERQRESRMLEERERLS